MGNDVGVAALKLGRVSSVARCVSRAAELASEAPRAEGASLPRHPPWPAGRRLVGISVKRDLGRRPTSPAVPSRLNLGQSAALAPPLPGRARQPVCRGDISRVLAVKLRHPRSFGSLELCVGDLLGAAGEETGDDGGHDGDRHWEDGGCDQALERSRWKRPDRVCVSYLLGLRGDSR